MSVTPAPMRIFVVGCARSGTTLTQRLLSDSFGLYSLPETRFFASLIGNVETRMFPTTHRSRPPLRDMRSRVREVLGVGSGMQWQDIADPPKQSRKGRVSMAIAAADFVSELDQRAANNGCRGWLEKTPIHVHYIPQIQRYVPDSWVVHVIRSPRQTIASIRDAAHRYPDPWARIFDSVDRAVDNWNAALQDSAKAVGQQRQIFVPYEALVDAPDQVIGHIGRRMGLFPVRAPVKSNGNHLAEPQEGWKQPPIAGPWRPASPTSLASAAPRYLCRARPVRLCPITR